MKTICKFVLLAMIFGANLALANGTHNGGHSPIGTPGQADKVNRSITVEANDYMRFTPAVITVKRGETIRFTIKNKGKMKHEFNLGTAKELLAHAELMKRFPNMQHNEPQSVSLAPSASADIVWQFNKSGTVDFACLVPGHYEAGMKGTITVDSIKMANNSY